MSNTSIASAKSGFTMADFLSTYRYWALFFSSLFMAFGGEGLSTFFPLALQRTGISAQGVGIFFIGSTLGLVVGALVALIAAMRQGRTVLIVSILVCGLATAGFLVMPVAWGSPVLLFLFGLVVGTVRAVFPLAIAIILVSGRPGKFDFACVFVLMSATILVSRFAPMATGLLYAFDRDGLLIVWLLLGCVVLAALVLLPAQPLDFGEAPRHRHEPLPPKQRSPLMIAVILLAPPILFLLMGLVARFLQVSTFGNASPLALILSFLLLCAAVGSVIYLAYWVYRIHGELAGAQASQRLLTPRAATLVAILAPFGLPILAVTLGDLLNDRARDKGQAALVSLPWLAVWSFVLPPLAIALVQNAANRSYAGSN
ncbi:MAG TPA: hypothetical protein VGV39_04905 [Mesorhizobium sp.]|jgi:MFS family permease|uniref:hypothetical protein n=1 Tax=Mesorhizobium sp. TaxID=1871066 RepID=UPI002DDD9E74|nr:hypothetical protein [Mesorhizobium sp.]HEV2502388.1 hypothetical protein [Mesorhizobium sp.]